MSEGRVKWFNDKKGFGFIETKEQGDVFVHYTAIAAEGFRSLSEGDRVSFEVERVQKGHRPPMLKNWLNLSLDLLMRPGEVLPAKVAFSHWQAGRFHERGASSEK